MSKKSVISSGLYIEGIEVTSEHEGMGIVVVTSGDKYLPDDFLTHVLAVFGDAITVLDIDNDHNTLVADDAIQFKWVKKPTTKPVPKTSPTGRKRLAKSVRDAEKELLSLIKACEDKGIDVDCTLDIKITYQAALEEY